MAKVRIFEITKVDYAILKKIPPDLVVTAEGRVTTSGWKNPELTPWVYIDPPKDGIQDFDFIADKPTGIVLQVLTRIVADCVIPDIDIPNYWGEGKPLLGVRVHATTNNMQAVFSKSLKSGRAITLR